MEYKLNKIDTELISKVNSTNKPGKIHKQNNVKFNADNNKREKELNIKMESYKKKEKENINKEDKKDDGTGKYIYVRK